MKSQRKLTFLAVTALAALGMGSSMISASAQSATETISSGGLSFIVAPVNFAYAGVTLNGTLQTKTVTQAFDVGDDTGSYAGWNVQITAAALTSGGNTLPQPSIPAYTPTETCDNGGGTCIAATSGLSYPIALPVTATKILQANINTGVSEGTFNAMSFNLAVPATAHAGAYAATWTLALTTGP